MSKMSRMKKEQATHSGSFGKSGYVRPDAAQCYAAHCSASECQTITLDMQTEPCSKRRERTSSW